MFVGVGGGGWIKHRMGNGSVLKLDCSAVYQGIYIGQNSAKLTLNIGLIGRYKLYLNKFCHRLFLFFFFFLATPHCFTLTTPHSIPWLSSIEPRSWHQKPRILVGRQPGNSLFIYLLTYWSHGLFFRHLRVFIDRDGEKKLFFFFPVNRCTPCPRGCAHLLKQWSNIWNSSCRWGHLLGRSTVMLQWPAVFFRGWLGELQEDVGELSPLHLSSPWDWL